MYPLDGSYATPMDGSYAPTGPIPAGIFAITVVPLITETVPGPELAT